MIIEERLEYLREQIRKECISYQEILELQSLKEHIEDVELLQWAENQSEESDNKGDEMKNIIITENELQSFDNDIHQEIANRLSDYISDKTGFCHKGFTFEISINDIEWDR